MDSDFSGEPFEGKKPKWLKTDIPKGHTYFAIKKELRSRNLVTVCEEAKCPNISHCWNTGTATFMVLGDVCTRACRFCHVKTGNPQRMLDADEPRKVSQSCKVMGLKYVVLTMVDRDDLQDGGADHVVKVVEEIKKENSGIRVELLAGDFSGSETSLRKLINSRLIDVFAHNVETIERLSPRVRDARASYRTSVNVLKKVKDLGSGRIYTKSSLMLGLGEKMEEVLESLRNLREISVDFVTLGQYMRPTKKHLSVKEWISPETFRRLENHAKQLGFLGVASGPLVRSSYRAGDLFQQMLDHV